jgi:hypothetical protein
MNALQLNLGVGQQHASWIMPSNRKLVRRLPRGSSNRVGSAYLFLFPFDIVHTAGSEPIDVKYKGYEFRAFPPFANHAPEEFGVQPVRLDRLPRLENTTAPHVGAAQIKRMVLSFTSDQGASRSDALRVDLNADDPGLAISFVDSALELMRFHSFQWWITRDRRFDDSYLRNSFGVNELGERVDEVMSNAKVVGRFGIERIMDRPMFESVVRMAASGQQAPAAIVSLLDALYFFQTQEYRRFLIEGAVACEILLVEHGRLIAQDRDLPQGLIKRELGKRDFEDRLDVGLANVLGRSFAKEEPVHYEWLVAMWIARNNVAHGKPAMTRHGGRTITPTREDFTEMSNAVIKLFMWYQAFRQFSPQPAN